MAGPPVPMHSAWVPDHLAAISNVSYPTAPGLGFLWVQGLTRLLLLPPPPPLLLLLQLLLLLLLLSGPAWAWDRRDLRLIPQGISSG